MKNKIVRIEFVQEGDKILFFTSEGTTGAELAAEHFEGCCEYECTVSCVIVSTKSLHEMGFFITI